MGNGCRAGIQETIKEIQLRSISVGQAARNHWRRALSLPNVLAALIIVAGVVLLPGLILREEWFWLTGLAVAGVFGFALLRGYLEVGIVCCLAAALFLELVLLGTWSLGYGIIAGASDMVLIALWIVYLFQIGSAVAKQSLRSTNLAELAFALFALCLLGTALSAQYPSSKTNPAYAHVYYFGLRGLAIFALTWRVLSASDTHHIRLFIIALLCLAVFISLNENANVIIGKSLLHVRGVPENVWWAKVTQGTEKVSRVGLTGHYFVPFGADPRVASLCMAIFLALALGMLLSPTEPVISRIFYGLCAASILFNLILYTTLIRASLAGALVAVTVILFYQHHRWRRILLLGGMLSVVIGLLTYFGVIGIGAQVRDPAWLLSALMGSDRWAIWLNTFEALPYFPLWFGIGIHNNDLFATFLLRYGTHRYPTFAGVAYATPHSAYLQILVGAGAPAFVAFAAALIYVCRQSFLALGMGTATGGLNRQSLVACVAACLAIAAMAAIDQTILYREINLLFCMILGATLGLARNVQDSLPRSDSAAEYTV